MKHINKLHAECWDAVRAAQRQLDHVLPQALARLYDAVVAERDESPTVNEQGITDLLSVIAMLEKDNAALRALLRDIVGDAPAHIERIGFACVPSSALDAARAALAKRDAVDGK
jgi:hypothetical protein